MSSVIIGLAVGLGVPLFIFFVIFVVACMLLCCCAARRGGDGSGGRIKPVEAINTFISWPAKTIGSSRPGTTRSSTTDLYPSGKDVDSVCGTTTSYRTDRSSDYSPPV